MEFFATYQSNVPQMRLFHFMSIVLIYRDVSYDYKKIFKGIVR